MRLDKYVASALRIGRREAGMKIRAGKIEVEGKIIKDGSFKARQEMRVVYEGKKLEYHEHVYLMINKPYGYLSATEDRNRPTVTELVKEYGKGLFPAGRLDIDTEGLLILTDDGAFVHEITSPKKGCPKKYLLETDLPFTDDDRKAFREGTVIKEKKGSFYRTRPAALEIGSDPRKGTIEITEGRYHQIKKMCLSVGKKVISLKRISIGKLVLDPDLKPGEYRELTETEKELAKSCV